MKYLIISLALVTASCNWAEKKAKDTVNKTGEVGIRLKSWGILEKVVVLQPNKTDKKHWKRIRKKNC